MRSSLPEELRIMFHNSVLSREPIEVPQSFYDDVLKLARQYARKLNLGVRTSRKDGRLWFCPKQPYSRRYK